MTFNGFCEGLYPNNQGGDTLFSLVRKLNELLPEMIEGIEEGGGGDSDINNLKLYYDTPSQSLQLQGVEGKVISEISAAPFIKDGMLNAVENNETEHIITLTFNTDAGKQPITLNYDSLWEGMETSLKGYTDSQVSALSSQVVKGIRLGSSTSNEPISDGVVTLPVASGVGDGVMSSEMYKNLNVGFVNIIGVQRSSDNLKLNYNVRTGIEGTSGSYSVTLEAATTENAGIMSSADRTKLDSIISTGDGTKFLADDFTYKTIQMPDLSTYATKSELSGYLPLSGGMMTGALRLGDQGNRIVYIVNYNGNSLLGYNGTENIVGGLDNSLVLLTSLSKKNGYLFRRSYNVNDGVWSDDYTIYDSGNFIAGTNYLAPGGVSIADVNNLGNNWSSILTGSVQSKNFTVNGSGRSVFGPSTETFSIYAPDNAGTSGQFLKSTGSTPSWGNIAIADVSGLQDSLDGKVNTTGDSFKNNNACWGGTRPDGTQTCLLYIDTNGNNKLGNCYGGTYLRAASPTGFFLEVGTPGTMDDSVFYQIYNEGNFKAGTNYVAPSTLNNYLPLSGGTLTGTLNIATENKIQVGTISIANNSGSGSISIGNSGSITRSIEPDTSIEIIGSGVCIRSMNDSNGDTFKVTSSGIIFNDNHVLTEADTFNTITYTTSASEDNLRAWNNYVNGYVTNLQAVDSSAFDLIRQSSGVDKVNRKFEVIIMGGSPRKLILITYTLAEDGSLTKTQENYTLTPATA